MILQAHNQPTWLQNETWELQSEPLRLKKIPKTLKWERVRQWNMLTKLESVCTVVQWTYYSWWILLGLVCTYNRCLHCALVSVTNVSLRLNLFLIVWPMECWPLTCKPCWSSTWRPYWSLVCGPCGRLIYVLCWPLACILKGQLAFKPYW